MLIAVGSFFIITGAFLSWKVPKLWHREEEVEFFEAAFGFMPFGDDFRRGEIRAAIATVIAVWSIAGAVVIVALEEFYGIKFEGLFFGFIFLLLAMIPVELLIVLFNRPKFLVPPHMRAESGLVKSAMMRRRVRGRD